MSSNNKSKKIPNKASNGINNRNYLHAINNIKNLWFQYNLNTDHYLPIDSSYDSVKNHLKVLTTKFNDQSEHHFYVIEHMLCFIDYPKAKKNKMAIWIQIMSKIRSYGLHNTYDIIKKYTNCQLYASAADIILIFDGDINKITQYIKDLKNYINITEILIELYDNDVNRIIIDDDDLNEIIFNNFITIKIINLERYYPINGTIKKIFTILIEMSANKSEKLTHNEKSLFAKFVFTYAESDKIQELIENYNIPICDEYVTYYLSNGTWNLDIFDWLVKSGARPDYNSLVRAYKTYKTEKRRHKFSYQEENYIKMLENKINDL